MAQASVSFAMAWHDDEAAANETGVKTIEKLRVYVRHLILQLNWNNSMAHIVCECVFNSNVNRRALEQTIDRKCSFIKSRTRDD